MNHNIKINFKNKNNNIRYLLVKYFFPLIIIKLRQNKQIFNNMEYHAIIEMYNKMHANKSDLPLDASDWKKNQHYLKTPKFQQKPTKFFYENTIKNLYPGVIIEEIPKDVVDDDDKGGNTDDYYNDEIPLLEKSSVKRKDLTNLLPADISHHIKKRSTTAAAVSETSITNARARPIATPTSIPSIATNASTGAATTTPVTAASNAIQKEPNYLILTAKSIFRNLGFLIIPGLLVYILINDSNISSIKKLVAFAIYFIYSMIIVVSDSVSKTFFIDSINPSAKTITTTTTSVDPHVEFPAEDDDTN